MSFVDSILIAAFSIALVFVVLVGVFVLIQLLSKVLANIQSKPEKETGAATAQPAVEAENTIPSPGGPELSTGKLKLRGLDEKTAAMIMAIVSHESEIPLSELRFKSIRAIDEKN